jgi:hypothetical protein
MLPVSATNGFRDFITACCRRLCTASSGLALLLLLLLLLLLSNGKLCAAASSSQAAFNSGVVPKPAGQHVHGIWTRRFFKA